MGRRGALCSLGGAPVGAGSRVRGPQEVTSPPWSQSPTELGTRVTRHPRSGDSAGLGSFVGTPSPDEHVLLLCARVPRLPAQGSPRPRPRPWRQWVRSYTGRLRSLARRDPKKSTDDIGKRLVESRYTCPTELCVCPIAQEGHPGPVERVTALRFWEAGPGVGLGRPPSAPRLRCKVLVHLSWDQFFESLESEPEESGAGAEAGAAPEPGPTASGSSASLQAGVESGATPAGAGEPAGDLGPVRGQRAPEQSQLGPASAGSTVPASAPNTVPAIALLPAPATVLGPTWMSAKNQGIEDLYRVLFFILFYFLFIIFYFKFILQSLTPIPTKMSLPLPPYPFSLLLFSFYLFISYNLY
ncbi:uncharacterized protein LOC125923612 [Panthera uncia]|uniref:uncharacterized protein LOC125923612 n=1 Tax=Panthera uncia TaxID=29064 RepID=UPI0020FFA81B|nr:uncharacterized protein LOC125923612 [Panthera uncia]